MSIELGMPSNYLNLYCPLLLLPSIFPSIRVLFQFPFLVGSPCSPRDSQESSTPQFKIIYSSVLSFLYSSTLTSRISNQSTLKEISPEYSLEGLVLKLKLQYFSHLMRRTNSLEKTLMLGKIESKRRRG